MTSPRSILKVLIKPVPWLFIVPLFSLGFLHWAEAKVDSQFFEVLVQNIQTSTKISNESRQPRIEFFRAHSVSSLCRSTDAGLARLKQSLCEEGNTPWQLYRASQASWVSLGLSVFALLTALALAGLSFLKPQTQYWTFLLGWRLLPVLGAVQLVLQGALMVFLSYWVPALLAEIVSAKLILLIGISAALTVFTAVRALFRRPPQRSALEGELVPEADAPRLWEELRALAKKLGTEPPTQVVAGIDDNFFVTESPVRVGNGATAFPGRTLYMSVPVLRLLDSSEASAVFAHELAHFRGGDTLASAQLSPLLERYDVYMQALGTAKTSAPVYSLMNLFRGLCVMARMRHSRDRELIADRAAAQATSPDDVARSLLKLTAYSNFRAVTERALFSRRQQQEAQIGLRQKIESGLSAHVQTPHFAQVLETATTAHPFDSHPILPVRLKNVGAAVAMQDAPSLVNRPAEHSWVAYMPGADGIEQRLWTAYEAQFRAHHNRALAYRYLPATDAEREHVLQFFPPLSFEQKTLLPLKVTFERMIIPERKATLDVRFSEILHATIMNNAVLKLDCVGLEGKRTVNIQFSQLGKRRKEFTAVFNTYWSRDQSARRHAREAEATFRS